MPNLEIIAHIKSCFPSKFGIPRQSGLVEEARASIIFTKPYRVPEALRGLETFSHIWLLWGFSAVPQKTWSPTVRPPRLGGNTRIGVFASRSPFRPNAIGLSSVKLDRIDFDAPDGPVIHVLGADLMDQTPIYDIKPYLPGDCYPDAAAGFTENLSEGYLSVQDPYTQLASLSAEDSAAICALLAQDPRPAYHSDPCRIYGMEYKNLEVKFSVSGSSLLIHSIGLRQKTI